MKPRQLRAMETVKKPDWAAIERVRGLVSQQPDADILMEMLGLVDPPPRRLRQSRPAPIPCPSVAAYKRGCRCEGCRRANADYARMRYRPTERRKREPVHGTYNEYNNHKCRCDLCREASRLQCAYYRDLRQMRGRAA